jgi:hypothetical protein
MNDLLAPAVAAHGGLERWNAFKTIEANMVTTGAKADPNGAGLNGFAV